jgi:hypothetical protein
LRGKKETNIQPPSQIIAAANTSPYLNEKLDLNEEQSIKKQKQKEKIPLETRMNFKN